MVVIGIAGGIASGKSMVSEQLKQLGAAVLDADRAAHKVLREPEVEQAVRERWGDEVFDEEGHVSRPAMAKIVFAPPPDGPEQLADLEQITHPRIGQRLRERTAELAAAGAHKAVVLDAPVMFKAGWDSFCDKIVFVEASREARLTRARQRGWTEADFDAREAAQESIDVKRNRSDFIIDNSDSPEKSFDQVKQFWNNLD